jgi:hypothetical protein
MSPAGPPPDEDGPEGGFLTRWSRLKRRPDAEPPAPVAEPAPVIDPPDEREVVPAVAQDPDEAERQSILASLPSIESITATTDISGFMHRLVPHAIRNAALRAAWTADPAIRDFLNDARDYALDYNTPGMAPGYGPLTESDDVQAMVGQIFGKPVDKSLAFLPESPEEDACGSESQSDPAAVHAAAQQVAPGEPELVAVRRSDRSQTAEIPHATSDGSPLAASDHADAAPQQEESHLTLSHSNSGGYRRRGGRATPA